MSTKVTTGRPRAARGSLGGRWTPRADRRPNLTGAITLEQALPAGTKLWLSGWTRSAVGEEFVSLVVEVASGGPRKSRQWPRQRHQEEPYEPEGRFRSIG